MHLCHPVIVLGGGEAQGAGAPVAGADPVHHPAADQPDEEGLDSHDERQVHFLDNQFILIMLNS